MATVPGTILAYGITNPDKMFVENFVIKNYNVISRFADPRFLIGNPYSAFVLGTTNGLFMGVVATTNEFTLLNENFMTARVYQRGMEGVEIYNSNIWI